MCASSIPPPSAPPMGPGQRTVSIDGNRVKSDDLLDAQGQLIIEHRGKHYQLRETRNGKLILTS